MLTGELIKQTAHSIFKSNLFLHLVEIGPHSTHGTYQACIKLFNLSSVGGEKLNDTILSHVITGHNFNRFRNTLSAKPQNRFLSLALNRNVPCQSQNKEYLQNDQQAFRHSSVRHNALPNVLSLSSGGAFSSMWAGEDSEKWI